MLRALAPISLLPCWPTFPSQLSGIKFADNTVVVVVALGGLGPFVLLSDTKELPIVVAQCGCVRRIYFTGRASPVDS